MNVFVAAGDVQDRDGAIPLLLRTRRLFPFIKRIFADGGYQGEKTANAVAKTGAWKLEIVKRSDLHRFVVLPKRWIVERTFAWISKHRRTIRDYEHLPASHEAMILWAMTALMTRRLAQTNDLSDTHLQPATIPCHPTTLRR